MVNQTILQTNILSTTIKMQKPENNSRLKNKNEKLSQK
jgi:hypothetical protein